MNIYIDESGYTGDDFLNKDQKVFVLASNSFTESELQEFKNVAPHQNELHFIKLKKSQAGRDFILKVLNHRLISEEKVMVSITRKDFALIGHIVDRLIEPVLYDRGINIYKGNSNLYTTNVIFYFGECYCEKELFEKFISAFNKMVSLQSVLSVNAFYHSVDLLFDSPKSKPIREILYLIKLSRLQISSILKSIDQFSLDVTFSSLLVIIEYWHKLSSQRLDVFQDDSKPVSHFYELFTFIKSLNIDEQRVGYGERKLTLPVPVNNLFLVSSENKIAIQISDLIASSITFMYNNANNKQIPFVNEIKKSKLVGLTNFEKTWPDHNISLSTVSEGESLIDFLANHLTR